jgi:hypothetical protein
MTRILSSTLIALCLLLFVSSCETYEYVDYQAMEDAEKKLLDDFYASKLYTDTLAPQADTIYRSKRDSINQGWVFLRKSKGTGDKLIAGKYVGIRFKEYIIKHDPKGNVILSPLGDPNHNYGEMDAFMNAVGSCSMIGLDSAFAVLNNYGKGMIIMSSNYWEVPSYYSPGSYTPKAIDFEITYYQK